MLGRLALLSDGIGRHRAGVGEGRTPSFILSQTQRTPSRRPRTPSLQQTAHSEFASAAARDCGRAAGRVSRRSAKIGARRPGPTTADGVAACFAVASRLSSESILCRVRRIQSAVSNTVCSFHTSAMLRRIRIL